MKLKELQKQLGYESLNEVSDNPEITNCYTSDLLSDVIGNAEEDSVFVTIQAHKNSIAVASLAGMPAIILCSGKKPLDTMIESATEEDITVLTTKDNQFTVSWKVAKLLGIS